MLNNIDTIKNILSMGIFYIESSGDDDGDKGEEGYVTILD